MLRKRKDKPQSTITPDAFQIDPGLMGMPLASVPRRGVAMGIDLVVIALFSLILLAITVYGLINKHSPEIIPSLWDSAYGSQAKQDSAWRKLEYETVLLVYQRMPNRLSDELKTALAVGDTTRVRQLVYEYEWDFYIHFENETKTQFDGIKKTAMVDLHPFMGTTSFIFNFLTFAILYFTIVTRIMKGYTPGKRLMKIRVLRLNGEPLKVWDTFGRAGGYTASLAMLGLGFAEAIWHPNRQAVHDRISGTVVVKTGRVKGS